MVTLSSMNYIWRQYKYLCKARKSCKINTDLRVKIFLFKLGLRKL